MATKLILACFLMLMAGQAYGQTRYVPFYVPAAAAAGDAIADNCYTGTYLDFDPGAADQVYCGATLCGSGDEDARADSAQVVVNGGTQTFTQSVGGRRPTWNWQDSRGNSKHSVSWKDSELRNFEDVGSWTGPSQPFTIYAVAEDTAGTVVAKLFGQDNAGSAFHAGRSSTNSGYFANFGTQLGGSDSLNADAGTGAVAIYTTVVNNTSSELRINDGIDGRLTGTLGSNTIGSLTIGNYDGANQGWDGPMFRLLICPGAHSHSVQDQITDQLGTLYSISGLPDTGEPFHLALNVEGTIGANTTDSDTDASYLDDIEDYPDGAGTSDWVGDDISESSTTANFGLENMPSGFSSMTALKIRVDVIAINYSNDTDTVYVQIWDADTGGSALTDEISVAYETDGTRTVRTVDFTGVVASNKTTWDGAYARFRWSYSQNSGPDNLQVVVHGVWLEGR